MAYLKIIVCYDARFYLDKINRSSYTECGSNYWRTSSDSHKCSTVTYVDNIGYDESSSTCVKQRGRARNAARKSVLARDLKNGVKWFYAIRETMNSDPANSIANHLGFHWARKMSKKTKKMSIHSRASERSQLRWEPQIKAHLIQNTTY